MPSKVKQIISETDTKKVFNLTREKNIFIKYFCLSNVLIAASFRPSLKFELLNSFL
jgi:hypothetical protein